MKRGIKSAAVKAESLDDFTSKVRQAFYNKFGNTLPTSSAWVRDVFADHIIIADDGKFYKITFTQDSEENIVFQEKTAWQQVETEYVDVKAGNLAMTFGDLAVKASPDGKISGYVIKFTDAANPDIDGDFFHKGTDFGVKTIKTPIYLHHCLPVKTSAGVKRIMNPIGEALLNVVDDGITVDGVLYDFLAAGHDSFERKVTGAVKSAVDNGKLGFSSGTATHLVVRTKVGRSNRIDKWPLGLDTSLTHRPAGIKHGTSVKSAEELEEFVLNIDQAPTGQQGAAVPVESVSLTNPSIKSSEKQMTKEEVQALLKAEREEEQNRLAVKAAADKALADEKAANEAAIKASIDSAVEAKLKEITGGRVIKSAGAPAFLKTGLGDSFTKGFWHYLQTDDMGGVKSAMSDEEGAKGRTEKWVNIGIGDVELDPLAGYCLRRQHSFKTVNDLQQVIQSLKTAKPLEEKTQYAGGELVPTDFYGSIVAKLDESSIARAAGANIWPVKGKTASIPVEKEGLDDMVLTAEAAAYDENDNDVFDALTTTVYKYTRLLKVSEELEEDEQAGFQAWLVDAAARAQARTENAIFMTGNGSSAPQGAVTGSGLGATWALATGVDVGKLEDCYYAMSSAYRKGAVWVMRGTTEGAIRKLQGDGFLYQNTPAAVIGDNLVIRNSDMDSLLTKPVFNTNGVAAIGSAAKSVLFGNFKFYTIAERIGLQVRRVSELYAGTGQTGILIRFRVGAKVTQADAFKHILHSTATA